MTDRFAEWDAAYLLGALSSADRVAYEEHIAGCAECRAGIADLAPAVGLLSRVPADAMTDQHAEAGADLASPDGRVALIERARAVTRHRRNLRIGLALAAVAVIVAAVAAPFALGGSFGPYQAPEALPTVSASPSALPPAAAMEPVDNAPVQASVRLVGVRWGTRIDLSCRYTAEWESDHVYALAVVGTDGTTTQLSTWRAGDGAVAHLTAGTALDRTSIRTIEIRDEGGKVLMTYSPN